MITQGDMDQLRKEMLELRERLKAGVMDEADAWRLLDRAEQMVEEAKGSTFEDDLKVIYSLLSVVWKNTKELADLRRNLAG